MRVEIRSFGSLQGAVMELTNYEVVRYPSGQFVITRLPVSASGAPTSGPRDVMGAYTSEEDAQTALDRMIAAAREDRRAA
jgi:hypothetical protein